MASILVSGLINIETTLRISSFPIAYAPVHYPFFGVDSSVSGVGYNVAKALGRLGHPVRLLSMLGRDIAAQQARSALAQDGLDARNVLDLLSATPQSVILYDAQGRRQIHVDLKDIQERAYPEDRFLPAMDDSDWLVLCNINFSRPFLRIARAAGKPIATDVHAVSQIDDAYNRDFMQAANVLFMSHEDLPAAPEEWARRVWRQYGADIVVIGLGADGALLCVRRDNFIERIPTLVTRPVVNTLGAGDALFAAFLHGYIESGDPYRAIRQAQLFASYKIGVVSAAEGFLDRRSLDQLCAEVLGT